MIDLGRPLTGRAVAQDVNRSGDSVGHATDDLDYQHAILWRGRTAVRLAEPPGAVQTAAVAVNDAGTVAGWADVSSPDPQAAGRRAIVWSTQTPGQVRDLGAFRGLAQLTGVTERDRLVGFTEREMAQSAALSGTARTGLDPLPGTSPQMFTRANGAAGRYTVGDEWVLGGDGVHPVRWTGKRAESLAGEAGSSAQSVNSSGVAVGSGPMGGALLWDQADKPIRLPGLVPDAATNAYTISDQGEVGGMSRDAPDPNGTEIPVIWSCR